MEAIFIHGNTLYFGGEETELHSTNLDRLGQVKTHKHCTDNGVMKIMSLGNKKLMVLSS